MTWALLSACPPPFNQLTRGVLDIVSATGARVVRDVAHRQRLSMLKYYLLPAQQALRLFVQYCLCVEPLVVYPLDTGVFFLDRTRLVGDQLGRSRAVHLLQDLSGEFDR